MVQVTGLSQQKLTRVNRLRGRGNLLRIAQQPDQITHRKGQVGRFLPIDNTV